MKILIYFIFYLNLSLVFSFNNKEINKEIKNNKEINNEITLTFLVLGDWGKGGISGDIRTISSNNNNNKNYDKNIVEVDYNRLLKDDGNNKNQKKVYTYQVTIASTMSTWITKKNINPQFILSLGDNFYDNGVNSVDDSLWITHWRDVYLKNFTNLRIPWYPVFGNHDYGYGKQGIQAQLSRTKTLINDYSNNLWQFPSTNYSKLFYIPGGGTLGIIFVDTTTLAPSQNKCCNQNGGISIEEQNIRILNQLSHLHRLFQEMLYLNPTWLIVVGHYPIFSRGEHGDISELKEYLLPLLIKYKVNAYICGHDHISEHLQSSNIDFFVAGAGSMTSSLYNTQTDGKLIWSGVGYSSFASIDVTLSTLTITYVRSDETIVYNYTITTPHSSFFKNISLIEDNNNNDENNNINEDDEDHNEDDDDVHDGIHPPLPHDSSESNTSNSNKKFQIITISASIGGVLGILSLGFIIFYRKYQSKGFKSLSMNSPSLRVNHPPPSLSYLLPYNIKSKKQKSKTNHHKLKLNDEDYDIEKQQQQQQQYCNDERNEEKILKFSQSNLESSTFQKLTSTYSPLVDSTIMKRNESNGIHKKAKSMPI